MLLIALLVGCFESTDDQSHVATSVDWPTVARESGVCFSTVDREIAAIGMDSGSMVLLGKLPIGEQPHRGTNAIARLDEQLYWCDDGFHLTRYDLVMGDVEKTDIWCDSVTDLGGGLLVMHERYVLSWYPSWDAVLAGNAVDVPGGECTSSRLGRFQGELVGAWHSTEVIERYDGTSGAFLGEIELEDYDTWVWGVSGVGDRLFVLNDGRGKYEGVRIAEFDSAGNAVSNLFLEDHRKVNGLTCSGPVDPETFVDVDYLLGTGPALGF